MLENPFTPGQVPRILAGRVVELRRIGDQVARVAQYGELGGPLLVFHAPRGVGKTSLLRTAQRRAEAAGCVTAWVACTRDHSVLAELVAGIERSLVAAEVIPRSQRRGWRTFIDSVTVQVGIPGVPVQASADIRLPEAPKRPTTPVGALEELLHEGAARVRARGGAGLVVFVDELHAGSPGDLAVLLNALQNLDGRREDNPLAVIAAGLPVTPEALTRAATFGERSSFVPLDLLSSHDARIALSAPAEALGVTWTHAALDRLVDEARGHPYFLQLLGSTTWDAAAPGTGGRLGIADVRAGVPAARAQIDAMHRARWNAATPVEQAFLRAMAEVAPPNGNVSRAAIAAAMGRASRAISVPRERLIEKGVIEPVGHGLVRFTLPGFGAYVLDLD
ncbi:MAG TPA: ATP-binding protein [Marmoricola sp.]